VFLERQSKVAGGLDRVINETQLTKTQARRFLVPYRLLRDAQEDLPKGEDFWVLGEALSRSGVKKYLQLEVDSKTLSIIRYDKKNLVLLLNYLYGPLKGGERETRTKVVHDTRDLSRLGKVLGSEKATAALRAGRTLEEAEIYVDTRQESIVRLSRVSKALGVLIKKIVTGNKDAEGAKLLQSYKQFDAAVREFIAKVD
jgi:hypothetical protein